MQRMDCLANFGPLQADFNCVKHCKGKVVKFGGVSVLLGGWWGPSGSWPETYYSLNIDWAQQYEGWTIWQIFGYYDLTDSVKSCWWKVCLLVIWGSDSGSPGSMTGGLVPLDTQRCTRGWTVWPLLGNYKPTLPLVFQMQRKFRVLEVAFSKGYGLRYRRHGFEASKSDQMS